MRSASLSHRASPSRVTLAFVCAAVLAAPSLLRANTCDPSAPQMRSIPVSPLAFEPSGLAGEFAVRDPHGAIVFSPTGPVLALPDEGREVRFEIAKEAAAIRASDELPGRSNFFLGNDPAAWKTNVPRFAKLRYESIAPGVDCVFHGSSGALEYDFEVAPEADPATISIAVSGASDMRLSPDGSLVILAGAAWIRHHRPEAYQLVEGRRQPVAAGFELRRDGRIGFRVGHYDRRAPLTIDPVLTYSTYLGGSKSDEGEAIAVDSGGYTYVTGRTNSTNFPTVAPRQAANAGGTYDVFVTKISPAGAVVFSTYLGGGGWDEGMAMAVDTSGAIYVAGVTTSTNFPTQSAYQASNNGGYAGEDGFLVKMSPAGDALVYSTYFGGKPNSDGTAGNDEISSLAVDGQGSAYVAGKTSSQTFPTTAGSVQPVCGGCPTQFPVDAFVAKFNSAGSALAYSTYLGGTEDDEATGLAVDSSGNAYVTGYTESLNFPTLNAFQPTNHSSSFDNQDLFVTKLNPGGSSLVWSTYLGGNGSESYLGSTAIAVDSAGSAYVAGGTESTDFPTANALQPTHHGGGFWDTDGFVTKFAPNGASLVYSTFLGGTGDDAVNDIKVDSAGKAFVAGFTSSTDFPTSNAFQAANGGSSDAIVATISSGGSTLVSSTYLGGRTGINGLSDYGTGIAVDSTGVVHVVGSTSATNFPLVNPYQSAYAGNYSDVFVARISADAPVCSLECTAIVPTVAWVQKSFMFYGSATAANCSGGLSWDWNFGDGTAHSTQQNPAHSFAHTGTYNWTLTVRAGSETCTRAGTVRVTEQPKRARAIRRD